MGWLGDLGNAAAGAFGKAIGGASGGYAANQAFSALNNPNNSRKENRKNFHQDMQQQWGWDVKRANLGRDIDVGAQQEMFDFRMQRGKDAGMTDYEMFMGPAAGAGGGTGAATQTLGNGGTSAANNMRQQQMQQNLTREENDKDRMASLAATAMQTKTQKEVAEIGAGTQTRGQDITADTAKAQQAIDKAYKEGRMKLDREAFEKNIELIDSQISVNKQQTKKLLNEVANTEQSWLMAMKQLSMGPANLLVELTMQDHGVNIETFANESPQKRAAVLAEVLALSSTSNIEGMGVATLFETVIKALQEGSSGDTRDNVVETLGNMYNSDAQPGTSRSRYPSHHPGNY